MTNWQHVQHGLSQDDIEVMKLLDGGSLVSPPPLVHGIALELQSRKLAQCMNDHWTLTPLGKVVLSDRKIKRTV
jgi:hypothetical protein